MYCYILLWKCNSLGDLGYNWLRKFNSLLLFESQNNASTRPECSTSPLAPRLAGSLLWPEGSLSIATGPSSQLQGGIFWSPQTYSQFILLHPNAMKIKGGGTGKISLIPISFICTTCTPSSPEFHAIARITPHHFEADTGDFLQRLP